jgi:hypothetical protein
MTIFVGFLCFSGGLAAGLFIRGMLFEHQDWMVLKWSNNALGWRPVPIGSRLFKDDKVIMSLELDASQFPDEGVTVE